MRNAWNSRSRSLFVVEPWMTGAFRAVAPGLLELVEVGADLHHDARCSGRGRRITGSFDCAVARLLLRLGNSVGHPLLVVKRDPHLDPAGAM